MKKNNQSVVMIRLMTKIRTKKMRKMSMKKKEMMLKKEQMTTKLSRMKNLHKDQNKPQSNHRLQNHNNKMARQHQPPPKIKKRKRKMALIK